MIVRTAEKIAEVWEDVILLRTFAFSTTPDGVGCKNARLYVTSKIISGAEGSATRYIYLRGEHQKRLMMGAPDSDSGICFRPIDMGHVYEMIDEGDLVEVI